MMNWLMNLEVQIWNLHIWWKPSTLAFRKQNFYIHYWIQKAKEKCTSVLFTKKITIHLKTENPKLQHKEARRWLCIPVKESISNVSVAVSLQAVTPYTRASLQKKPFSQSVMWQQALGKGRQRTGLKSRVSLDLVWSNKGHDSESKENRNEFQLGK